MSELIIQQKPTTATAYTSIDKIQSSKIGWLLIVQNDTQFDGFVYKDLQNAEAEGKLFALYKVSGGIGVEPVYKKGIQQRLAYFNLNATLELLNAEQHIEEAVWLNYTQINFTAILIFEEDYEGFYFQDSADAKFNKATFSIVPKVEGASTTGRHTTIQVQMPFFNVKSDDMTLLVTGQDSTIPPPTSFTATSSTSTPGTINLAWTDASTGELSFQVFRKTGASGTYALLATTAPNATTYTDSIGEDGTQYYYKVRAEDEFAYGDFSNEDDATTLSPLLQFTTIADGSITFSVVKSGDDARWRIGPAGSTVYSGDSQTRTVTPGQIVYLFGVENTISEITANNCQIIGTVDFSNINTALTVSMTNSNFTPVFGDFIGQEDVTISFENSIIGVANLTVTIDNLILANGGTITDDGTEYTGLPGATYSGRGLVIGTITVDITDPEYAILYEKIVALESVGWQISTVLTLCDKQINFNTGDTSFVVTFLGKTRKLNGLDYVAGDPLDIDLYDTLANANTGGATGRLALGYSAVNTYLLNDTNYNAWTLDDYKYIRLYAADTGSTENQSTLRYNAVPSIERPCGQVEDVFGLAAYAVYSVKKLLQSNYTGALVVLRRSTDSQIRAWYPLSNGNLNYSEDPSYDGTATLPSSVSVNLRPVDLSGALRSNTTVSYDVQRTGDINTWKGAGTVRVVVILDQSGNGAHVSEPNTTYQPKLDLTYKCITENNASLSETSTSDTASILSRHIGTAPSWASGANNPKITIFASCVRLASSFGTFGGINLERQATVFQYRTPSNGQLIAGYLGVHKNSLGTTVNNMSFRQRKSTVLKNVDTISTLATNSRFIVAAGIDNQQTPQRSIYANGIEEVSDNDIYTNFTETNFYISMCTAVYTQNFGSSKNFGTSDVIVYQEKLTSAQIEAVTNLLNV